MIPIRLGTVGILRMVVSLDLVNTLLGLILVYIAQAAADDFHSHAFYAPGAGGTERGRPPRWRQRIPHLLDGRAAGAPGVGRDRHLHDDPDLERSVVPPDPGAQRTTATVTLGVQQFLGQFVSDWNAVLSSLTLAMIPIWRCI